MKLKKKNLKYILTVNNDQYYVYSESTTLGNTAHHYMIIIITIITSIHYLDLNFLSLQYMNTFFKIVIESVYVILI